jgi:hypothetical protein
MWPRHRDRVLRGARMSFRHIPRSIVRDVITVNRHTQGKAHAIAVSAPFSRVAPHAWMQASGSTDTASEVRTKKPEVARPYE